MAESQIEDQNEQQQQQPANHSSDNAEIARCLTRFSHPGLDVQLFSILLSFSLDVHPYTMPQDKEWLTV